MLDWLFNLYQGPGWLAKTMLEIGIITAGVYILLGFMRGTRGAGVLRGLILLYLTCFLTLLVAARVFHLDNVVAIMESLVQVSLLAAVVIFQPEIRRGLVRLGEGAWRLFGETAASLEDEIADAAVRISKEGGVGGLIVIERETKIGSYIESGVRIDAAVTSHLLRTIFTKNTPLHDGAVIVRRGRLAAANCLLPLSENVEVCRGMGTRHRAAIGLSEESDALVIVVSEETGQISTAMNGAIERDLDYESLRAILRERCFQMDEGTFQASGVAEEPHA